MKNLRIPTVKSIKKWIQDIVHRIKLFSNVTVRDDNLMRELDKLDLEQGISLKCKTETFLGMIAKINGSFILVLDLNTN